MFSAILQIARNTFREGVRQPIFYILLQTSLVIIGTYPVFTFFVFREQEKLVSDGALATTLLFGWITAVLLATHAISREIETGTVLLLLAKPVNRVQFLLAKLLGLLAALALFVYINGLATLLALRIAKDQFQLEMVILSLFFGALVLASIIGAVRNYYRQTSFTASAIGALAILLTLVAIVVWFLPANESVGYQWGTGALGFNGNLARALVLVLFATWAMGALAAALSTRLNLVSNLTVCFVVFCLGLISDYLYVKTLALNLSDLRQAVHYWPVALLPVLAGIWLLTAKHYHRRQRPLARWDLHLGYGLLGLALLLRGIATWQRQAHLTEPNAVLSLLAQALYQSKNLLAELGHALIPNWQLLFLADAITNQSTIPWAYLALGLAYVLTFIATFLILATLLFAQREVGGQGQAG